MTRTPLGPFGEKTGEITVEYQHLPQSWFWNLGLRSAHNRAKDKDTFHLPPTQAKKVTFMIKNSGRILTAIKNTG